MIVGGGINVGDKVSVIGGKYQGRRAVVVKCMNKMVSIRFLDTLEEVRVKFGNVALLTLPSKSIQASSNGCVPAKPIDPSIIICDPVMSETTAGNVGTDHISVQGVVEELRVIRSRIDELIVLLDKMNFGK